MLPSTQRSDNEYSTDPP